MNKSSAIDNGLNDALTPLSADEQLSFANWYDGLKIPVGRIHLFQGVPFQVLNYKNWMVDNLPGDRKDVLTIAIAEHLMRLREGSPESSALAGQTLLLTFADPKKTGTGHIAILSQKFIARFMETSFPKARLTPALLRLLTYYLGGLTLNETARRDGKSIDTRKRQAQELRRRLGLDRESSIIRVIGPKLHMVIDTLLKRETAQDHAVFLTYVMRFLPSQVRPLIMHDTQGRPVRLLDMGPIDGRPIVALHPMILPDLCTSDIALLENLGLRLLWPLRNGLYAPNDPGLDADAHLEHAVAGIERLRQHFIHGSVSLLSFAASSKVALCYAKTYPGVVRRLVFAAACVLEQRPASGERRLAKGMVALSRNNPSMMRSAIFYLSQVLLSEQRFPDFIRNRFRDCPADSRLIADELERADGGERMRQALQLSVGSILHDFIFQADLGWDRASGAAQELHFMHGEDDRIHPLSLIEALAAKLGAPPPHVLQGGGQMLHGPHFRGLAEHLATLTEND